MQKEGLEPGKLYNGVVKSISNTKQLIYVSCPQHTTENIPCIYVGGVMSSLLGFNTTFLPENETRVLFMYTKPGNVGYVVGCLPEKLYQTSLKKGLDQTTAEGKGVSNSAKNNIQDQKGQDPFIQHRPSADMFEGEFELKNIKGVALSLLQNLAKLNAGDLAKVECHLVDDMVRIISDKFKHFTAFGDYEIYNDNGKLNVRWLGTSKEHESYGGASPTAKKAETDEDTEEFIPNGNPWYSTGRWRFHNYIGSLGNFINFFISDPMENVSSEIETLVSNPSGRFRSHVNEDGSFLLQSVSDIVLERVVKIPVPVEKKRYDDPKEAIVGGALSEFPLYQERWTPNDPTSLFEATYQLRDYARWLNEYYSLASFHASENYVVPSFDATNLPAPNNADLEKVGTDPLFQSYYDAYSTIRIFRDGSIVIMDTNGSAVNMSNGDVTISAAKNLNLEAANHIHMKAGNDVYVNARRHIEFSAFVGGIIMRCKTWWQTLCESGTALLESRANPAGASGSSDGSVQPKVIEGAGVLIKAKSSAAKFEASSFSFFSQLGGFFVKCARFITSAQTKAQINNTIIDREGVKTSGKFVGSSGIFQNLPGWMVVTITGPTPVTPDVTHPSIVVPQVTKAQSVAQINEAQTSVQTIREEMRYQTTIYSNPTLYESITQQHLRLGLDPRYSTFNTSTVGLAGTGGISFPYPGKNAPELAYQPNNKDSLSSPNLLSGISPNIKPNQAGKFTPKTTFTYLNL